MHHQDVAAGGGDGAQVVADIDQGAAGAGLLRLNQGEHLGLRGFVERSGGLVEHEQVGLAGDGRGDDGALALAAGSLMRVARGQSRGVGDLHGGEQVERGGAQGAAAQAAVAGQNLIELGADGQMRGERLERVLRHQGDTAAAQAGVLGRGGREDVGAVEQDAAGGEAAAGAAMGEQGAGQRGLAAAGFADDAEGAATLERERDAVDGAALAPRRVAVGDDEALDAQQGHAPASPRRP